MSFTAAACLYLQHTFPFPFGGWLVESWQSCSEVIEVRLLCLARLLFICDRCEDCRIDPQPRLPLPANRARKGTVALCTHFGNYSPVSLELEEQFFFSALVKTLFGLLNMLSWYLCMCVRSVGRFLVCHLVVCLFSDQCYAISNPLVERRAALKMSKEKVCLYVLLPWAARSLSQRVCSCLLCRGFDWHCFVDLTFSLTFNVACKCGQVV